MREIKFRAWDIKNKTMIHDVSVSSEYVEYDQECYDTYDEFIPMQFTGLKDKNGKDVYEGDIVRGRMTTDGKTHYGIDVVEYADNEYDYGGRCIGFGINGFYLDFEVIGNVYENPELLNKETI